MHPEEDIDDDIEEDDVEDNLLSPSEEDEAEQEEEDYEEQEENNEGMDEGDGPEQVLVGSFDAAGQTALINTTSTATTVVNVTSSRPTQSPLLSAVATSSGSALKSFVYAPRPYSAPKRFSPS